MTSLINDGLARAC